MRGFVVVGKQFDAKEPAVLKAVDAVQDDEMIFDIGPKSAQELVDIIMKAGTVEKPIHTAGNYKQCLPVHYHVKEWLTDKIIKQLEDIHNG